MKITKQQFNKSVSSFKKASLSVSEKNFMKEQILGTITEKTVSPYASLVAKGKKLAAGTSIGFLALGSVAFASTGSLPGDPLYSIKTEVVEPIVGLVINVSAKSKQEYELKLAQNRLDELVTLEKSGGLNDEAKITITTNFNQHIGKAKAYDLDDASLEKIDIKATMFTELINPREASGKASEPENGAGFGLEPDKGNMSGIGVEGEIDVKVDGETDLDTLEKIKLKNQGEEVIMEELEFLNKDGMSGEKTTKEAVGVEPDIEIGL